MANPRGLAFRDRAAFSVWSIAALFLWHALFLGQATALAQLSDPTCDNLAQPASGSEGTSDESQKTEPSEGGQAKLPAAQEAEGEQAGAGAPSEQQPSEPNSKSTQPAGGASGAGKQERGGDPAGQHERRAGRLIRISSPITDKVQNRIKRIVDIAVTEAKEAGEWPVLIFEIRPGRSEFGQAFDLARYLSSPSLNGATTVAWLPDSISGHAVLVAMACDQIVMHETAEIGKAGEFESVIDPSIRSAYKEIANRRKTIPADLALKMLDSEQELLQVETDVSREYVVRSRLDDLRERKSFDPAKVVTIIGAGKPGVFSGAKARELGFVSYLADDRAAVAKALGLPAKAVDEDLQLDGGLRPVRIDLDGPVTANGVGQIQTMIQNQIRDNDVNFICLWIDSPGGSPTDSTNLANFLTSLEPTERRTVAYIPAEARADAAFVALACDQIVMHPQALLGGSGAFQIEAGAIESTSTDIAAIARQKRHSPALATAMVDPNLDVFKYTRQSDGLVEYFSEADAAALDAKLWTRGEQVTVHGQPLLVDGEKAEQLGLARHVVADFNEFKSQYGLEHDPTLAEPGWADYLIDALNSPGVSWFLLLLGGAALYAELQSPGVGLGGLIAALCFLLYFWSAYLGGTAGWLEVLLFVAGMVCLLIEAFVLPGFGLFGLAGGLMVLCSLILASQTFILPRNDYQLAQLRDRMLVLTGAGVGIIAAVAAMRRFLPHAPMFNRMLLAPPTEEELTAISHREALTRLDHLLGEEGVSFTSLVPGGKARFGDQLVDVIADGQFIERGQRLQVVDVRGNRVLVRSIA